MDHPGFEHPKWLTWLDHTWPYITGMAATMLGAFRLWCHDRKETKKRIQNLEIMAEHFVSRDDLLACRDDVRREDKEILEKIDHSIAENAKQHQDIMKEMMRLHTND